MPLRLLVPLLIALELTACVGRPRRRPEDDDDDAHDVANDDDTVGVGVDGAYAGTVAGQLDSEALGLQVCSGAVDATVADGRVSGTLDCDLSLQCQGSWEDTSVPGTATLSLVGCLGSEAPLDLLWSDGDLLGLALWTVESSSLGLVDARFSFSAFLQED